MPSVLAIIGAVAALYLSTFIYALLRNLYRAWKTGLPYVLIPMDQVSSTLHDNGEAPTLT